MNGFLYYAPGRKRIYVPTALDYAFEGEKPISVNVSGPVERGCIYASQRWSHELHNVGYFPDRQEWREMPELEGWQLGYFTEHKPTPIQLQRNVMLEGHEVVINGQHWKIPVARRYSPELEAWISALPQMMKLNADCQFVPGEVIVPYRELWEAAQKWWDFILQQLDEDATEVQMTTTEAAALCVPALRTNYRINWSEIDALELFDDLSRPNILRALVDMPTFEDVIAKKKQPAQQVMSAGVADSSPITDPQFQSSG